MESRIETLNQIIRNRRSVFTSQFVAGATVDESIIQQMLENATWAPNHGRQEPWHFVVFCGAGLQTLASFQSELYKRDAGDSFVMNKFLKLQNQPLQASHVIAICMKRTLTKPIAEVEDIAAVACAVQNMYLTAEANGVGAYWSTGGITYYPGAKPFFGLAEHDRLMGFFIVGQIASPSKPATRKPLNEKVTWVREGGANGKSEIESVK